MKAPNKNKPTYVAVRDELALLGIRLLRDATGNKDYKVNFIGGDEPTAYYTSDLKDALSTGIDMAKRKQKSGPNLGALLATSGFVQNYKKSSRILTFWENGDVFAITSPNGFGLYVGDTSYGGSTEEHLRGYLATFTAIKQTLSKQAVKEDEGSYQAFTPKDGSAGEKQRVEKNLLAERLAESSDVDTVYMISLPTEQFATVCEEASVLLECSSVGMGSAEYTFSCISDRDEALRKIKAHILKLLDECKHDIRPTEAEDEP